MIAPGQLWRSSQAQHDGWVVKVTKVSRNTIKFEGVAGPGHARKAVKCIGRAGFEVNFHKVKG